MHYIQKDIIQNLANGSPLRFSQLQPAHVPNNAFSYHLKKLLASGYIEMTPTGYVATRKALKTLQYTDESQQKKNTTPTVLTMIYVTNDIGEVLILKRRRRPFINYYSLPAGLVHTGETLDEAAKRELEEKTGIKAMLALKYVGVLDFQYLEKESDDIFVHAIAFVYTYNFGNKPLSITENQYGKLSWSHLTRANILPEVRAVHDLVQNKMPAASVRFEEPTLEY